MDIEKIVLDGLGDQKLELTMDEARELHARLDELFGSKVRYAPSFYPNSPPYPAPVPTTRSGPSTASVTYLDPPPPGATLAIT